MVGQDPVETPSRLHEHADRLAALLVGAGGDDLPRGVHDPADLGLERGVLRRVAAAPLPPVTALLGLERRPHAGDLVAVGGEVVTTRVGEPEGTSSALVVAL